MYVLGIHADGGYFKVALMRRKGRKLKIQFLQEFKKEILDLNQLKKKITKESSHRENRVEIVSALGGEELFVRQIKIPLKNRRAVMQALPFQMESLLPTADENTVTIPLFKRKGKDTEVKLYSFLQETMYNHIQDVKILGFDPDWVSSVPQALLRFVDLFVPGVKEVYLFHLGWESSYMLLMRDGELIHSVPWNRGLKEIIDAVRADYPERLEIDFAFIKEGKRKSEMKALFKEMEKQLLRGIEFLRRQRGSNEGEVDGVIYTGYADLIEHILNKIDGFSFNTIPIAPHLEFSREQLASYAVEIGLALDVLERDQKSLQLRVFPFIAPRQLTKLKKRVGAYLSMALLSTVALCGTIAVLLSKKEAFLKERFAQVVKLTGEHRGNYPEMQKMMLSQEGCTKEVAKLLARLNQQRKEEYILSSALPVHEIMQKILSCLGDTIVLQEFSYELEEYPQLAQPHAEFKIKLTLLVQERVQGALKRVPELLDKVLPESDEIKKIVTRESNGTKILISIKQGKVQQ